MESNQNNNTLIEEIMKHFLSKNQDGLKIILETLFNLVMKEERTQHLNAKAYERNSERNGYANGYKPKKRLLWDLYEIFIFHNFPDSCKSLFISTINFKIFFSSTEVETTVEPITNIFIY